jgi:hypothetical protein
MAAVEASVSAGEGSGVGDNSAVALKGGAVSKSDAFEAGARPSSPGGLLIMVGLLFNSNLQLHCYTCVFLFFNGMAT